MSSVSTLQVRLTVRELRRREELSQCELAELVELSSSTVSAIELGTYPAMQAESAARIADIFDLTVDQIDWMGVCVGTTAGAKPGVKQNQHKHPRAVRLVCHQCFTERACDGTYNCDHADLFND